MRKLSPQLGQMMMGTFSTTSSEAPFAVASGHVANPRCCSAELARARFGSPPPHLQLGAVLKTRLSSDTPLKDRVPELLEVGLGSNVVIRNLPIGTGDEIAKVP